MCWLVAQEYCEMKMYMDPSGVTWCEKVLHPRGRNLFLRLPAGLMMPETGYVLEVAFEAVSRAHFVV